jgi:hypothetical protein
VGDRVVVHFGYHAQRLVERGIGEGQIALRALVPGDWVREQAGEGRGKAGGAGRRRVALIADLPVSDAGALGVDLPTHQAVFGAAREIIGEDYLRAHPGMSGDIVRRALARAGVDAKTDDPALKEPMVRIVREVLIAAVPVLTLAGVLVREGLPLLLVGDWPGLQVPLADMRQVSLEGYTAGAWEDVAVCVHFSPQGTFSPILWEAAAAGVAIVSPAPAQSATGTKPAGLLREILRPERDFAEPAGKNLVATIKALGRDVPRRERLVASAGERLAQGGAGV